MELKPSLDFLTRLKENNNKVWFDENRKEYESCRAQILEIVQKLIEGIASFDPSLTAVEAKQCIFRINRDIRFSKDKTPYKTNFGALMGAAGRKTEGTGYYFHVAPGHVFTGGGIYKPQPDMLAKIRQEIDYNSADLVKVIEAPGFKERFGEIQGEQLKTAPKGYPKDHPFIHLLRYKSYYVLEEYSDKNACSENFIKKALESYKEAFSFNQFLNDAIN
ncbi:DUF2461 domain-containing protein [Reichenbachiella ulvae]|uniref:DUF2461 domain-containing protein n=1 Tax=Reichenbachiella ulvae TaxID=2980104 RepID=A0ABT3CWM0_9BACT|nr:DUF2461 domain-containing protein [Reichenbachiella ulvae]MCV9388105.1 DUF2461 domain-containing protein [Reichenbachiella ulvae]